MGQISSINFKKSNAIQTRHNDRDLPPSYLIGGNIEINRNSEEALKLKDQMIQEAKQTYKEKFKQKFKSTSYEWSAVCNIKPDSKMEDLEKLANHFKEKYGFQCYQIAIHRDEGHIDEEGNKVINHHAHMEFVMLDKNTGKNTQRTLTPKTLRQIQTETAEILQMQRGEDKRISKRKRIEPRKYAQMKEEEKKLLEQKDKKIEELVAKKIDLELEKKGLEITNQTMQQQQEYIQKQINKLQEDLKNERTQRAELTEKEVKRRLEEERQKMIKEKGHTQEDYRKLGEIKKLFKDGSVTTMNDLEREIKSLQSSFSGLCKEYTDLKAEKKALERENQELRMELSLQRTKKAQAESQARMSQKSESKLDKFLQKERMLGGGNTTNGMGGHTTTPQPTTTEQTTTTRHIFTHKKKSNDIEW